MGVVNKTYADGVCTLILNRPDKKNAMSLELLRELYDCLKEAEKEKAAIVVIRGAGKTFCAGGDVIEFRDSDNPGSQIDVMADYLHKSICQIRTMPAIVVAVVEGLAVGAGLSISLACDLTIAENGAVMNTAYRKIGLTPDGGASIFLPRLIGMKRFNEAYFLSRNITMAEAKEIGIVNFVVDEAELEAKLAALIGDLKALPGETVGTMKELVNRALWTGLETHLDKERRYVAEFSSGPEFQVRLRKLFKK